MRTLRTEIDISAPASTVWNILTDTAAYTEWNPFLTSVDGRIEAGLRLRIRFEPPGGRAMTVRPRVVMVESGHAFAWLGYLGFPGIFDGRHRFEIESPTDGSSRLVHSEDFSGVLVPLLWPMLRESTEAGFHAMNAALKTRSEGI